MGFLSNILRSVSRSPAVKPAKSWAWFWDAYRNGRVKECAKGFSSKEAAKKDFKSETDGRGRVVYKRVTDAEYRRISDSNTMPKVSR